MAPIALYPDALVAQILSAATFPDQVAVADNWLQTNKALTGSALTQAVDKQTWDPSVKALTQFPSVLDKMAQSLAWTSSLGEAYHNQQADVMTAVQTLRAQAQKEGNLKSGPQITVVQQSPQTIVIQPTNPQIVYVPEYNPTVVYGTAYVTPGYSTGALVATGLLSFGAGLAVGAMMSGGCCGWGYSSWNCNWHGGAVYYHGGAYYGNSAWHGGYYGSSGSYYGAYGSAHASEGYNPSTGTYARGGYNLNAYGTQKVGQSYNAYTGASAATHQGSNSYSNWEAQPPQERNRTHSTTPAPPNSQRRPPTVINTLSEGSLTPSADGKSRRLRAALGPTPPPVAGDKVEAAEGQQPLADSRRGRQRRRLAVAVLERTGWGSRGGGGGWGGGSAGGGGFGGGGRRALAKPGESGRTATIRTNTRAKGPRKATQRITQGERPC